MASWLGEKPDMLDHREKAGLPTPKSSSSFWHKEPSALLLGHRSTRDLPETADVVVVGSGMTGTSIVHHLLNSSSTEGKLDVVLLEAREACWGATGRNGGHCQPILFEHPDDPSIGHFELDNFHTLHGIVKDKNIDCEFVVQPGVRGIYSQSHLDTLKSALETVKGNAPDLASMMKLVTDEADLAKLRIPTAIGAVVTSIAARMWPYKLVSRILEDLLTSASLPNGTFNLQTLTPVTKIGPGNEVLVETERGTIRAKKVVLATNAYTSHLLAQFSDLIVPCRGQMSALRPLPSIANDHRLTNSYGFLGDGLDDYLIQRPDESGGHLMFGGGRQHGPSIGVTDDSIVDEKTSHYLRSRLLDVFRLPEAQAQKELDATHIWTGIMGFSRDEHPWIGPVPGHAGVYLAAGFTGHGMPNCWLSGKAIAEIVAGSMDAADEEQSIARVCREIGLPECYLVSEERMHAALKMESVEQKDWAEMDRGQASF